MLDQVFAADSALMRALSRVGDVMLLNVLFVATSLPLVTIGASLTALQTVSSRLVRGTAEEEIAPAYLRAFRAHLRQGSALLAVLVALAGVLGAWYVVVNALASPMAQLVLLAVWGVLGLQLATTSLIAFAYLARFEDTLPRVLLNSLLMSWRHPGATLTLAAVTGLPVVLTVLDPRLTGYGLLWLVGGFAVIAVVAALLLTRVFDRYTPTPSAAPASEGEPVRAFS